MTRDTVLNQKYTSKRGEKEKGGQKARGKESLCEGSVQANSIPLDDTAAGHEEKDG